MTVGNSSLKNAVFRPKYSPSSAIRHADINHVLSHRAQEKIDKYRAGYAALDARKAFLPAVVSTSGPHSWGSSSPAVSPCRQQD